MYVGVGCVCVRARVSMFERSVNAYMNIGIRMCKYMRMNAYERVCERVHDGDYLQV